MKLLEDTGQVIGQHDIKNEYFKSQNIEVDRQGLYVGDYVIANKQNISIDTKKDLQEIILDVTKDHVRFRKEMIRAQEAEIKLIILCEHGENIKDIEDVKNWHNPRLDMKITIINEEGKKERVLKYPNATSGEQLYKIMKTQEEKYGVKYLFCDKEETGKLILELLGVA